VEGAPVVGRHVEGAQLCARACVSMCAGRAGTAARTQQAAARNAMTAVHVRSSLSLRADGLPPLKVRKRGKSGAEQQAHPVIVTGLRLGGHARHVDAVLMQLGGVAEGQGPAHRVKQGARPSLQGEQVQVAGAAAELRAEWGWSPPERHF